MQFRRSLLVLAALAPATTLFSAGALAQTFPAKPITIVIGSTPGSATDGLARSIATEVTKATGQSVIVDNRAGAFGSIAAQYVARAQPDGYTVFMTTNTTQSANPHLLKKIAYDPIKDFAPVSLLARGLGHLGGNTAGQPVGGAAGSGADHDGDGFGRKGLGQGTCAEQRGDGGECGEHE